MSASESQPTETSAKLAGAEALKPANPVAVPPASRWSWNAILDANHKLIAPYLSMILTIVSLVVISDINRRVSKTQEENYRLQQLRYDEEKAREREQASQKRVEDLNDSTRLHLCSQMVDLGFDARSDDADQRRQSALKRAVISSLIEDLKSTDRRYYGQEATDAMWREAEKTMGVRRAELELIRSLDIDGVLRKRRGD
jgi:hypothetical protein